MTTRLVVLIAACGVLLIRMFTFIAQHSVNILFWDQWDIYSPLFNEVNWWDTFRWEQSRHRGVGMTFTRILAQSSGWNTVIDSMAVGAVLGLATVAAMILKYRLLRSTSFFDVTIPLLCLTLFQYESLVVMANAADRALPLLMLVLYCFALTIGDRVQRCGVLLAVNLLMVYTGYGILIAPVTIGVLALDAARSAHDWKALRLIAVAIVTALASTVSFLFDYRGTDGDISFRLADVLQYPAYISLMLAAFWGWHASILGSLSTTAGVVLSLVVVSIGILHARRILRNPNAPPISLVITVLSAYALLHCTFTAVGRTPLGLQYAQVSRYVTSLIPLYLAVYFHLISLPQTKTRQVALAVYLLMASLGSLPLGIIERVAAETTAGKTGWKECYLRLEDAARCDQLTGFQVYPDPSAIQSKLQYLKKHRLNLYLDAPVVNH